MTIGIDRVIVTCEHGGNRVPAGYSRLFRRASAILATHRGYDIGALAIARALAGAVDAPLRSSTTTRLLIDLNRSLDHAACFSEFTSGLAPDAKAQIAARFYTPHREAIETEIAGWVARRRQVLHLSVHSFTPILHGIRRNADIGLLYDPRRPLEQALCARWGEILRRVAPGLRFRRNYPYLGRSDGFTTALRRRFGARTYLGIELEVNQGLLTDPASARRVRAVIVESVLMLLDAPRPNR